MTGVDDLLYEAFASADSMFRTGYCRRILLVTVLEKGVLTSVLEQAGFPASAEYALAWVLSADPEEARYGRIETAEGPAAGEADPLKTAELIRVFALLKKGQCSGQLSAGPLELFHRDPLRMIAGRPFQHPAGVVYLSQNEVPRIGTALGLAFRNAVLCLPEKDIAALFPDGACQKLAVRAEKTQVDPVSGAFSHQGRAGSGTAETDDPFQCVKRDPADLGFLAGDNNIFAVQ